MYATPARRPPFVVLLAIAAISLFIIVLLVPGKSSQVLVSTWRPEPVLTRAEPSPVPGSQPPTITGATVPLATLDLHVADGLYTDQRDAMQREVAAALAYAAERFGSPPTGRFTATFVNDDSCGLHGIAYTDVRNVQVFTCNSLGRDRAINIMAHEITHQLEQDRYGPRHLSADLLLSEGMATYGAGKYWLAGQPDFRSFVKAQRAAGVSYPLATNYAGLGVAAMNALYYQWASFVEFLIQTEGRAKFDALYITGHSDPGSADYNGVYGKPLPELEREWAAWVER